MTNEHALTEEMKEHFGDKVFETFGEEFCELLDRILSPKVAIKIVDGIFESTLVSTPMMVLQVDTDVSGAPELDVRHPMIGDGETWFYPTTPGNRSHGCKALGFYVADPGGILHLRSRRVTFFHFFRSKT